MGIPKQLIAALRRRWQSAVFGLVTIVLATLSAGVAYAAFVAMTENTGNSLSLGSVALTDDDGGVAMLNLTNAQPGATDSDCIKVTKNGTFDSTVRHHATVTGSLAPYLTLKVTRGSGATFGSCGTFTADARDYFGDGAGVIYNGKLSDYPGTYALGRVDPADAGGTNDYATRVAATTGLVNSWRLGEAVAYNTDTFTDASATALTSHTGELGASWATFGTNETSAQITGANRARRIGGGGVRYYASGTPATADYSVQATMYAATKITTDSVGVIGRADVGAAGGGTYYSARYDLANARWELLKTVGGTTTTLGTYAQTIASDDQLFADGLYTLRLDMRGSTIRLLVDGVQRVSVTDTSITAAGTSGVTLGHSATTNVPSDTTGMHLDNFSVTPNEAVDSKGANDGEYVNGVTRGAAGALFDDANTAAQFDGTNDHVTATRQVQDDFTLEYWFKSTQGLGTTITYRGGAGLVNATGGTGTVSDFGTSLSSTGQVVAGVGNPDTQITSASGFNDGKWHHVAFTRTQATGAIRLYVDGLLEGSATGGTQALSAGAALDFARVPGVAGTYLSGTLDEVATYNAPLSAETIAAHYNAVTPSETWSQNENHAYKFDVTLGNSPEAEGLSGAATFRWEAQKP